ncbi:HTTM domain-containing protein [Chryseobacterium sp. GMJ5]|uniref:HTTM domain-containing protein n=1 Tax=Chryseobacterium gilvum TaxID=2976534 RepID=A0ABT2VVM0_9FLAO|nr:HTTM domain-containing protein [Chryseobacterium gilvum]MCU7613926.1 HTTM domain-containing protein [Chryseobacterium gilvum]
MNKLRSFIFGYEVQKNHAVLFSNLILLVALINILSLLPDVFTIFSKSGIISPKINALFVDNRFLTITNLTNGIEKLGLSYNNAFMIIILVYIVSIFLSLLHYFRVVFAIMIILLHTILLNSSYLFSYGADFMLGFLLYCNLFFSIASSESKASGSIFSFTLRLMQMQLCIIYFFGGFGKYIGFDWYNGNAMWMAFNHYMNEDLLNFLADKIPATGFVILSIGIMFLEISYPFLIFNQRIRKLIMILILSLHIGIGVMIGLYTFAVAMIVFNLIAFYPDQLARMLNFQKKLKRYGIRN